MFLWGIGDFAFRVLSALVHYMQMVFNAVLYDSGNKTLPNQNALVPCEICAPDAKPEPHTNPPKSYLNALYVHKYGAQASNYLNGECLPDVCTSPCNGVGPGCVCALQI